MRNRAKSKKAVLLLGAGILFLSGCGKAQAASDPEHDTLVILKDGSVEITVCGDFDRPYYSEEELVSSVEEELLAYNTEKGGERISLKEHHTENGKAFLTLHFTDHEDCCDYLKIELYVGTVQGAYDEGYDITQALISRRDEEQVIGKNDLKEMAGSRIVICGEDYRIICPEKIDYYSYGCRLEEADEAVRESPDPEEKDRLTEETVLIY